MNVAPTTSPGPWKILVVDDNPIIQRAVYFGLRDHGYQVLMAGDVSTAIKILRQEKIDMLFVDLSFPLEAANIGSVQQDGFFLIDWVKRTPEIVKSPIIIISSTEPEKYRERAAASGINTCMQKPLNRENLLATVRSVLGDGPKTSPPGQP